jgi:hypothetical protein
LLLAIFQGKAGFKNDEAIRLKFTAANTNELLTGISLAFPSCEKVCIGEGSFRMNYLRRRRNHMEQWSTPEQREGNKNNVRLEVLPRLALGIPPLPCSCYLLNSRFEIEYLNLFFN